MSLWRSRIPRPCRPVYTPTRDFARFFSFAPTSLARSVMPIARESIRNNRELYCRNSDVRPCPSPSRLRVALLEPEPVRVQGFVALFQDHPRIEFVVCDLAQLLADHECTLALIGMHGEQVPLAVSTFRGLRPELRLIVMGPDATMRRFSPPSAQEPRRIWTRAQPRGRSNRRSRL